MSGYWLDIALVAFLVILNAAFAGSEMALVSLREGQLRALERSGGARAMRLVRLARDPNRFLATIQIGITLAGFLASATAAVSLAEPLVPHLAFMGGAAEPVTVAVITLVLAFITLVVGELAPKRIAMQRALPWALAVAGPLNALATISRPAVALLGASTNVVVKLLGGRAQAEAEEISPEELRDLVTSNPELDQSQRDIISGALELQDRMLRHVLVPRGSVLAIPADATVAEARRMLADAGHSRAPVTRGHHLDQVVGVVHWGALVEGDDSAPVTLRAQPALMLPDTVRVLAALHRFREERQQLAIVIDEHGSVDGIVTLEDLLEEIVGEIWDETDPAVAEALRSDDGELVLPGTYPVHDLVDVGVDLDLPPSADFTTVAGLVLKLLGRVPDTAGDVVEVGGWRFEVLEVAGHAVTRVRLTPGVETPLPGAETADSTAEKPATAD
ncbi:hemolysin family protein [Knoellia koreensis]|uniref:HlyC/CorC family transporter n=1 Tax=Knoellia koreensis TaxID=2730921 RepID=A0A849HFL9_9MICO|nr:hemolysin family protein [Knoellia sp. DB2414S]NNM45939.1 HlyC/CorC family transporter [Knoellia sp. DB2414S]